MRKYIIKAESWLSRILNRKRKFSLATAITAITIISFLVSVPIPLFNFEVKTFEIEGDINEFRTGETVSFSFNVMHTPARALIVFGDGQMEDILPYGEAINGRFIGTINHSYALQGKYTPILQVWNEWGTYSTDVLDLFIKNAPPDFDIALNGEIIEPGVKNEGSLRTSKKPTSLFEYEIYEDDKVEIAVVNLLDAENLTYIYDTGEQQISSKEAFQLLSWKNKGRYPLTVTAVGSLGELSYRTVNINVHNKAPKADFSIKNRMVFLDSKIELSAENSSDTPSDKNSLKYLWNFDGGRSYKYGKQVSYSFAEAGTHNITLTVKDNDGEISSITKSVYIDNPYPLISLQELEIPVIQEGEQIIFHADSFDDDEEVIRLLYYWNFDSEDFDPLNVSTFELGGWKYKKVYEDDYKGYLTVAAVDSLGQYSFDAMEVQVINVDPQVSANGASFITNITFHVLRNDIAYDDLDFICSLVKDDSKFLLSSLTFENSTEFTVSSDETQLDLSVLNDWKIEINSSDLLPENATVEMQVDLKFLDGQVLSLSSGQLSGGSIASWVEDLTSHFYNGKDCSYNVPITIRSQIYDPSVDDVSFVMTYFEEKLFEIECESLPDDLVYSENGIVYKIDYFESLLGVQYAHLTASQEFTTQFEDHPFLL